MLSKIPSELRDRDQWVVWTSDKVPHDARSGSRASVTDPTTWSDFRSAVRALRDRKSRFKGIGFVFTGEDPYVGIDLDDAVDKKGALEPWAGEIVQRMDSYAEFSPSGRGVHVIVRGKKPGKGCKAKFGTGKVEIYETGRYFTVTGDPVPGSPVEIKARQEELTKLCRSAFGDAEREGKNPTEGLRAVGGTSLTDEEIIDKARNAENGEKFALLWNGDWEKFSYSSQSEADMALCAMLAFYTGPDPSRIDRLFRRSGLYRPKWDRDDYAKGTIGRAVQSVREFHHDVGGVSMEEHAISCEKEKEPPAQAHGQAAENEKPGDAEFPEWVMKEGLAGDFALLHSEYLESPVEFFYMAFLTCLGTVLSGKLTLDVEIRPQPRLYTLLLGESADARKSTAIKKTVEFFNRRNKDLLPVCRGAGSAEGLQQSLKDKGRMLLFYDEFSSFVSKCGIKSSVLLPCVNTLFEDNNYENNTKKSRVSIQDAHLGLLAASTVDTYEQMWCRAFTDMGFNNRLWLVPGRRGRSIPLPEKIPKGELDKLSDRLEEVLERVGARLEMPIEERARSGFENWYDRKNKSPSILGKRLDTYAIRLMPLLAVDRGLDVVGYDTYRQVRKLADWQLAVRKIYDPIDADNKYAKLEENIRRQLRNRGTMTISQLKQYTNAHKPGIYIFDSALNNLKKAGEIAQDSATNRWDLAPRGGK